LTFTNQSDVDPNGTATYAWTFGDNATSNLTSPTHTYMASGSYQIFLTSDYSGLTGCTVTTNKSLTVAAATKPAITISTPGICAGETKQLTIDGTFTTINWSTGATGATVTINQPGTYSVNTVDANGCADKGELIVAQNPTPSITVTADKTVIAPGQSAQLIASGADSYQWAPTATLDNATIASPKATPLLTTTYFVEGFTLAGCSAKDSIAIKVDGGNTIDLKVTNVFSPNGDGHNDVWIIPGIESYQDCTLSLYDPNGSKIFEQKGYRNDWDGNYKGQPAPQGTYYYVIICSDKKPLTGSLLLAR
jgi:gliding motility-associated-like protein